MTPRRRLLLPVLLLALLAACGLGPQPRGEPVPLPEALPTPPRPPGSGGDDVVVYLVAGSRLEPVARAVPEGRPQDAVDQLLAGPTRAEVAGGLRTALSPQHLTVLTGPDDDGTVTVTVTRGFTGIGGGNQLLAVAQVVWTVTQFPRVDDVLFALDGGLVAVPTDDGLTDRPVVRSDFSSVAPAASSSPSRHPTAPQTAGR